MIYDDICMSICVFTSFKLYIYLYVYIIYILIISNKHIYLYHLTLLFIYKAVLIFDVYSP